MIAAANKRLINVEEYYKMAQAGSWELLIEWN